MALLSLALLLGWGDDSPIKTDESVIFFPTAGYLDDEATHWIIPIHGWIFEPETNSLLRSASLGLFRRGLGLEKDAEDTALFLDRARRFIVDNESGKKLSIRIGRDTFPLEESGPNGHFLGEVRLTVSQVETLLAGSTSRRLVYQAVVPEGDKRVFLGTVHLIGPRGVTVISDLDDTVKISQVRDRKALLNNTFVRPFVAVPGMAPLYQQWAKDGAVFHFVSSSPWQLHTPLADFLRTEKFPEAVWHMKLFRWKDSSFFDLFASPETTKPKIIEPLLEQYPRRKFILVGDSGEKDPEVYGGIARKFPDQVLQVLIRDVTDDLPQSERMQKAFADVPAEKWQVFKEPQSIRQFEGWRRTDGG
jgi:hypothetical protein